LPKKVTRQNDQRQLQRLCKAIRYEFRDMELLEEALTHRSKHTRNNERLEYLGDSILGFLIAKRLYDMFPEATEGELSRCRSKLVKGETLAKLARAINLGDYLLLGPGELKSGGFRRNSTLADAFEAVMGAIYLDSGMQSVDDFVVHQFAPLLEAISLDDTLKDPKTQLQEYMQARRQALPEYTVISTSGSDHEQLFQVQCVVEGLPHPTVGEGSSRRKAEQAAAHQALELIND
jgi:ribonuclease-3